MGEEKGLRIEPGRRVVLHYRLTLEDGTVADDSFDNEPLGFTVGDGTLVVGLEQCLMGLASGDEGRFGIGPEQAFGYPDSGNIQEMPRSDFPPGLDPQPGQIIGFSLPSGEEIPGTVLVVDAENVRVDFNHPLAGHRLDFQVRILSVE